jgi:hypothetical protein
MALDIHSRADWGARPPESTTPWTLADLDGVCVHWFGSPTAVARPDQVPAQLRGVQAGHMAPGGLGVPSGGSDIAYNFGVDQFGEAWTLRGWNVKTGANGAGGQNSTHIAFVVMIGKGDKPTDKALATLGELIREAHARGVAPTVVGHGAFTGSECPGPDLRAWIARRGWTTEPRKEEDMPDWLLDWATWYIFDRQDGKPKPEGVPAKIPQDGWDLVSTITGALKRQGAHPTYQAYRDWRLVDNREGDRPDGVPEKIPAEWWPALETDHAALSEFAEKAVMDGIDAAELRAEALAAIDAARERVANFDPE